MKNIFVIYIFVLSLLIGVVVNRVIFEWFFPFDVLIVNNLDLYNPGPLDKYGYLAVIEQPFKTESDSQIGGTTARFPVRFIYNFGNPPEITALLKCEDGSIYEVPKAGEIPKLIGPPGMKLDGISDYNLINERASGKTCHMEFDAEWKTMLQTIHKKLLTTDFYVE